MAKRNYINEQSEKDKYLNIYFFRYMLILIFGTCFIDAKANIHRYC